MFLGSRRRLALVVGSQSEALVARSNGEALLSCLPDRPGPVDVSDLVGEQRLLVEVRDLLVEGPGDCIPVDVADQSAQGLLLNPTAAVARSALEAALAAAHQAGAVLVVHVLAHGSRQQRDPSAPVRHLLHVWDTLAEPVDDEPESRGWDPYDDVRRRLPHCPGLAGLVLVVDACWGSWSTATVASWSGVRGGLLSAVLAASEDTPAWDACLTRTVREVLASGLTAVECARKALLPELLVGDIQPVAAQRCPDQVPRVSGFESGNPVLYLGRNIAADVEAARLGLDGATSGLMLRLTRYYTEHAIAPLHEAVKSSRVVCVVGDAGTGKSTLAAALRSPPEESEVPIGLVQAAAFVAATPGVTELAASLQGQLGQLPGFQQAAQRFQRENRHRWDQLDVWQQDIIGPLSLYHSPVRVLIDGLDQLDGTEHDQPLRRALTTLLKEAPNVSLVLLSPSDPHLSGAAVMHMPELAETTARRYLEAKGVDAIDHDRLVNVAAGRWLVLDMAAGSTSTGARSLEGLYDEILDRARKATGPLVDDVLAVLAAAGSGPVLPFDVLEAALHPQP